MCAIQNREKYNFTLKRRILGRAKGKGEKNDKKRKGKVIERKQWDGKGRKKGVGIEKNRKEVFGQNSNKIEYVVIVFLQNVWFSSVGAEKNRPVIIFFIRS